MNETFELFFNNLKEGSAIFEVTKKNNDNGYIYKYVSINPMFEKIIGITKEHIIGKNIQEVFVDLEDYWLEKFDEVLNSGKTLHFEEYYSAYNRFYEVEAFASKDKKYLYILFNDKTNYRQEKLMLEKYKLLIENARDVILLINLEGQIIDANDAAINLYEYSKDELQNMSIYDLRYDTINKVFSQMKIANSEGILFETEHKRKNGAKITVQVSSKGVKLNDEEILFSVIRDISEEKKYKEYIQKLAYTDSLTGIPNRMLFFESLDKHIIKAKTNNKKLVCMLLDLDSFKYINDTYGHYIGDFVLVETARKCNELTNKDGMFARYGGDEFVLYQYGIGYSEALNIARKLLEAIKIPIYTLGHTLNISASIGISIFPDNGDTSDELMKNADEAMYKIKRKEGSGYSFYNIS